MRKKQKQLIDENGKIIQFNENSIDNLVNICDVFPDFFNRDQPILLPDIPGERIAWELAVRPNIKGEPNRINYLPMVREAILDPIAFKMYLWGRQWGKTTAFASDLAFAASTHENYDQTYINFEWEALKTFSNNKFRVDVFEHYPMSEYIEGYSKFGSMSQVRLKNHSIIDMITHLGGWKHAQGKSNKRIVIDEGNDIDWTGWFNLRQTQADTMGDTLIGGIGGYVDTKYHKIWKTTNQMEWEYELGEPYKGYENMSWRRELEEQCFDQKGIVYNDAMKEILRGKWVPKATRNYSRHGFHISQLLNPRIPLTRLDAIELYHVHEDFSIEAILEDPEVTQNDYRRNVLAEFVEGELKPITTKMMLALFDKNVHLTKAEDVDHNAGRVYVGIDWGGGDKTIIWIWQCLDDRGPIFKTLWIEKVETNDISKQIETCKNLIDAYEANKIVVDAGGGVAQTQDLQKYYGRRCIRNSYQVRPEKPVPTRLEIQKLRREMRYVLDRTFSINRIIDLMKIGFKDLDVFTPRFILPGADYEKIKWIIAQFVAVQGEEAKLKATGQTYIKYTHLDTEPDDALHACNYAYIAWYLGRSSGKIEFFDLKPKDPFEDGYAESHSPT